MKDTGLRNIRILYTFVLQNGKLIPFSRKWYQNLGILNIVSLPKYIDEIRNLLADQYFNILALNETRLEKKHL